MKNANNKKKGKTLSPEARAVYFQLDGLTREQIKKNNPLKQTRNQRIRELRADGLKLDTLVELTGLNRSSLSRIMKEGSAVPDWARREMKALARAFESFLKSVSRVLNHAKDEQEGEES
jgi:DNA invertase Pin-like site-specific DNA recombinase